MIELISCYQEIWKDLPEAAKEESNGSLTEEIQNLHSLVKSKCPSLLGLLNAKSNEPAFIDSTSERTLTHANVSEFVKGFSLPVQVGINGKPRVAVVMPYGPTYSLACVAVSSYYTLVPLASHIGSAQTKSDIRNSHTTTVLVLPEDAVRLQLDPSWERETGVTVITVRIRDDMTFEFVQQNPLTSTNKPTIKAIENDADDVAMVLFTSGTSGSKKLVPITAHNLLASIAFTAKALELTESDCCLNMMPSNHM
jgi:long-subunit acyl-CoA synthetase (AMP-forming)